jgi:hypothetical protein
MKIDMFVIGFVLLLSSNSLGAIEVVSVEPERPVVGDEVFLNIFISGEEQVLGGIGSISIENNTIEVAAGFGDILFEPIPPDKTESFSLGELPAGDFLVNLSVESIFTSPTVIQTFSFSVLDPNSRSSPNSIPTLGEYSMPLLSILLGLLGFRMHTKKHSYS